MRACIIQPEYSLDYSLSDQYFKRELELLNACVPSMDIIVLPEACDVPCLAKTKGEFIASVKKYNEPLLNKVIETAKRCNAVVFVNAVANTPTGLRNTTYAYNRHGTLMGCYYKQHLTWSESHIRELDNDYTFEFEPPTVIEIDGIRYGFLTCYDFYFYEMFAALARQNLDVIIGCSHQRTDSHTALEFMTRNLAYNTNAYVLRSSVSLGEASQYGGCSMAVAPNGDILLNMKSRIGMDCAEFDVRKKFQKPAGFGNSDKPHCEYIEDGRRPWKYRPGGSAIARNDLCMPYPRVCAHRGFNVVAPENSMAAYGAAVAMGAEEIEFDLWTSKDGEIVSLHDSTLDRVSTGYGNIWDYTYNELLEFDFGVKYNDAYSGMKILRFEEILKHFSCHTIMNIHIKTRDNDHPYDEMTLRNIESLIKKYDCEKYCYYMSGNDHLLRQVKEISPNRIRCVGGGNEPWRVVDRAIELGCEKVQFFKPYFNQAMIDKAHAHRIQCNVFWSDDPDETRKFLDMGVDVILTNDFQRIQNTVKDWKQHQKKEAFIHARMPFAILKGKG